jgi:hypothetical protein
MEAKSAFASNESVISLLKQISESMQSITNLTTKYKYIKLNQRSSSPTKQQPPSSTGFYSSPPPPVQQ